MPASRRSSELTTADSVSVRAVLDFREKASEKSLSYEFFPPREDPQAEINLWSTLDKLLAAGLDFVSVTYGAGGSNRSKSLAVLERMASQTLTVGHLTAVGSSRAESREILKGFVDVGVRSVLALRGDSPKGDPDALERGELKRAIELVELASSQGGIEIGVAAFPEGHPESPNMAQDHEVLKLKQDAGASFAITQLFFGASHYQRLVSEAQLRGAVLPIIPGVMPISNAKQVLRMAELSGAAVPSRLLSQLDDASVDEARRIGMDFTIEIAAQLLQLGAPGLHIYTLNQADAALEVASAVGLVP